VYGSVTGDDYDYSCPVCGKGYYAEVGFGLPPCGCPQPEPEPLPENPLDEVYEDPRYVTFDDRKAFLILRQLNLLHMTEID
jgi:hypothetical protein